MKRHKVKRAQKPITTNVLKSVSALTYSQTLSFQEFAQGQHIAMVGSAGTGKTFLACAMALDLVLDSSCNQDKVVIIRSAQPARDIGALPGTEKEKMEPYEAPYVHIFDKLFTFKSTYDSMKKQGLVEFEGTSFLSGQTIDNAVIIIDEIQNMKVIEFYLTLTRIGLDSKIIVCGDGVQSTLTKGKCWDKMIRMMRMIDEISIIEFGHDDIVRSKFVKSVIIAAEKADII